MNKQNRDVERALMIDRKDDALISRDVLKALDPDSNAAGLQDEPGPKLRATVLPMTAAVENRA